jgi:hypothetical protein
MALPEGLLAAVRNYLDITWADVAGDEKLTGIIARGIKYLNETAGAVLDYTLEEKPRELLMDYCRYARSNKLEEFQVNYLHELLSLQNEYEIKYWATLKSLAIGTLNLTPAFSYDKKNYTATTNNDTDIITAIAAQAGASVQILHGETEIANGAAAVWKDGENTVVITVQNGSTINIYTVVVTKGG